MIVNPPINMKHSSYAARAVNRF